MIGWGELKGPLGDGGGHENTPHPPLRYHLSKSHPVALTRVLFPKVTLSSPLGVDINNLSPHIQINSQQSEHLSKTMNLMCHINVVQNYLRISLI